MWLYLSFVVLVKVVEHILLHDITNETKMCQIIIYFRYTVVFSGLQSTILIGMSNLQHLFQLPNLPDDQHLHPVAV